MLYFFFIDLASCKFWKPAALSEFFPVFRFEPPLVLPSNFSVAHFSFGLKFEQMYLRGLPADADAAADVFGGRGPFLLLQELKYLFGYLIASHAIHPYDIS